MNIKSTDVDIYIKQAKAWQPEMSQLRKVILDCGLTEDIKWGKPCYSIEDGSNIVIIQGFKSYCALLFFKGVLLSDHDNILVKTGKNTQVGRQVRFTDVQQIKELTTTLKTYIIEAIELEKSGAKVSIKKKDIKIPEELERMFQEYRDFKSAFDNLTLGRQRAYIYHFAGAKQSKTRIARIEKYIPKILSGKGIND